MKSLSMLTLAALMAAGAAQAQVIYSNGPVVGGNGLSVLQNPPNTTLGVGMQIANGNAVADDFTVGGLGWDVTGLSFFSYQTGATSYTFTNASWSIVSGDVNSGTVVASGLTAPTNGGLMGYRVSPTTLTNTQRPIYRVSVDIADITLAPGTYWLRWSLAGTLGSGPWQPTTSDSTIGNLHQSISNGAFAEWADATSGLGAEAPFEVLGVAVVPEPGTYALMLAGIAGVGAIVRRRRQQG